MFLFLVERTALYRKASDQAGMRQLTQGIRTKDGAWIRAGCGLQERQAWTALAGLEKKGLITRCRTKTNPGDFNANEYTPDIEVFRALIEQRLGPIYTGSTQTVALADPGEGDGWTEDRKLIARALQPHAEGIDTEVPVQLCEQLIALGGGNARAVAAYISKKILREFSTDIPEKRRRAWPWSLNFWLKAVRDELYDTGGARGRQRSRGHVRGSHPAGPDGRNLGPSGLTSEPGTGNARQENSASVRIDRSAEPPPVTYVKRQRAYDPHDWIPAMEYEPPVHETAEPVPEAPRAEQNDWIPAVDYEPPAPDETVARELQEPPVGPAVAAGRAAVEPPGSRE